MAITNSEKERRAALREAISKLPKPQYGSIVVDDSGGFRARISRKGGAIICQRGFRLSWFNGSVANTHHAAREWLKNEGEKLPTLTRLNRRTTRYKKTSLPVGVSAGHHMDPRTGIDYLSVMVLYRDARGRRSKTFRVGRPEWIDARIFNAIAEVACAFRKAYEDARDNGHAFDASRWRYWRKRLPDDVRKDLEALRKFSNQERRVK